MNHAGPTDPLVNALVYSHRQGLVIADERIRPTVVDALVVDALVPAYRHNVGMASLVDRLTSDSRFVVPVTRKQAAAYARRLATRIEQLPDFERFPEGELGVVVYALIAELAQSCPDRGDFGQLVQAVEAITRSAAKVVGDDTFG